MIYIVVEGRLDISLRDTDHAPPVCMDLLPIAIGQTITFSLRFYYEHTLLYDYCSGIHNKII